MSKATRHTRHLKAVYDLHTEVCATCGETTRGECKAGLHPLCSACAEEPLGCVKCLELKADRVRYG